MTDGLAASPSTREPSGSPASEGLAAGRPSTRETRERIPAHLRHLVVEQAYAEYNAVDQAVWRFVLTQIYDTLRHTAHPAYEYGLSETGISTEHIPHIEEMDRCLRRYGWGAVCVDGFIPPRAFVEFQSLGILPIAADIRSKGHLTYTPAPDIIHEAAGHAPILPDARYASFLRRIGSVGATAFGSREDTRVYKAIYALSEVKERPGATEGEIAEAERAFNEANEAATRVTEATRMSRLYWWTAEYGLVGTPEDYKLFGAGLLSSLWESHACHDASVRKLPLTAACTDVAYDITRAQPQLFVAQDFDHLGEVLSEVESTLCVAHGGEAALREAALSGEVATLLVGESNESCLVGLIGTVAGFVEAAPLRIRLEGPVGITVRGQLFPQGRLPCLVDNAELILGHAEPAWRIRPHHVGDDVALELAGGARLSGRVSLVVYDEEADVSPARTLLLGLRDAHLGDKPLPGLALFTTGDVVSARAGAADPAYYPPSKYSSLRVPGARAFGEPERALIALHTEAGELFRSEWGSRAERIITHVLDELQRNHPDEWLLRYHLLEALLRAGQRAETAAELRAELERMEVRFAYREPIALGLRRLARITT